jgi:hypothetical protein
MRRRAFLERGRRNGCSSSGLCNSFSNHDHHADVYHNKIYHHLIGYDGSRDLNEHFGHHFGHVGCFGVNVRFLDLPDNYFGAGERKPDGDCWGCRWYWDDVLAVPDAVYSS